MGIFDPLLRWLLSPWGIGVLAALDSTLIFWLPLGIDVAMVIMGASDPDLFWIYALIAAAGSMAGSSTTFWIGRRAGEAGLSRFVPERKLDRIKSRVHRSGALTLAALDLIPPPFPFTLIVVAAGALDVSRIRFSSTLAAVRGFRFGLEAWLGARYGTQILSRLHSQALRDVAGVLVAGAIVASVWSLVRMSRPRRKQRVTRSAAR